MDADSEKVLTEKRRYALNSAPARPLLIEGA